MDRLNQQYFNILLEKYRAEEKGEISCKEMIIFEDSIETKGKEVVYPTAIASKEAMKELPHYLYKDIKTESYAKEAKSTSLWLKKMQAGTGSSLKRDKYLAKVLKKSVANVIIGAKGTDLFVEIADCQKGQCKASLAEIQILQALKFSERQEVGEVILHDIVGPETKKSFDKIWKKKSIVDSALTYRKLIEQASNISYHSESYQDHLPTIDKNGQISQSRTAPGGHAFFAVEALIAAYDESLRPEVGQRTLISSIGNGEDLSSIPDKYMLGLMKKEKIAIAMVTTDKTQIDLKGGQISLLQDEDGATSITIVEKAQAETSGQLKLFEQLGLRSDDATAFFNTNMALFNYEILGPKISKLVDEIGEEKFLKAITPDLIRNRKKQIDEDGKEREYLQLEGAMGSVLLNLDRFWRKYYKESLVTFINVDKKNRTHFFSPIKMAFDFFMQFHSDRFSLDESTMQLQDLRAGHIPAVSFESKYYAELANVLDAFEGVQLKDLDQLVIENGVILKNMTLSGKVHIYSKCDDVVDLNFLLKNYPNKPLANDRDSYLLKDLTIVIDSSGNLQELR